MDKKRSKNVVIHKNLSLLVKIIDVAVWESGIKQVAKKERGRKKVRSYWKQLHSGSKLFLAAFKEAADASKVLLKPFLRGHKYNFPPSRRRKIERKKKGFFRSQFSCSWVLNDVLHYTLYYLLYVCVCCINGIRFSKEKKILHWKGLSSSFVFFAAHSMRQTRKTNACRLCFAFALYSAPAKICLS